MAQHTYPKLHNATWPGVVGKGEGSEPAIDLDTMLDLTAAAEVNGARFEGFDLFLFDPHLSIDATDDDLATAEGTHDAGHDHARPCREIRSYFLHAGARMS